ncbi:hypothetical protein [Streptomyces europaeiscabiei]|nr:hypothetical protein [Streptomyces europaeiscabiei]MDX3589286.1 hypothetical protein [Streptomyces europaeiscabiei]
MFDPHGILNPGKGL